MNNAIIKSIVTSKKIKTEVNDSETKNVHNINTYTKIKMKRKTFHFTCVIDIKKKKLNYEVKKKHGKEK